MALIKQVFFTSLSCALWQGLCSSCLASTDGDCNVTQSSLLQRKRHDVQNTFLTGANASGEVTCTCKSPNDENIWKYWADERNYFTCTDGSDGWCAKGHQCAAIDALPKDGFTANACKVTCKCMTPNAGTNGHNSYGCSDATMGYCDGGMRCGTSQFLLKDYFKGAACMQAMTCTTRAEKVNQDWNCQTYKQLRGEGCYYDSYGVNKACVWTRDECATLAGNDPECSTTINYYGDAKADTKQKVREFIGRCTCVRKGTSCRGWRQPGGNVFEISCSKDGDNSVSRDAVANEVPGYKYNAGMDIGLNYPVCPGTQWKDGCMLSFDDAVLKCNADPKCGGFGNAVFNAGWMNQASSGYQLAGLGSLRPNKDWQFWSKTTSTTTTTTTTTKDATKCFQPRCGVHGVCVAFETDGNVYCYGSSDGCLWGANDCQTDLDCQKYVPNSQSTVKYTDGDHPSCATIDGWRSDACTCKGSPWYAVLTPDTTFTGPFVNDGNPRPVTLTLNLGGNFWIVGAVDGQYLKMSKIQVTGTSTYTWVSTFYDEQYASSCAVQATFNSQCFKGQSQPTDVYPLSLKASLNQA